MADTDDLPETDSPEPDPVAFDLRPIFSAKEFNTRVSVGGIVESYDKAKHGSVRRKYEAEFSAEERKTIDEYATKFRGWYLRTGLPTQIKISIPELNLMIRASRFFCTC